MVLVFNLLRSPYLVVKDQHEQAVKLVDEAKERVDKADAETANSRVLVQALQQRSSDLTTLVMSKDRPIVVQAAPDLEVQKLLARQEEQLVQLKGEMPSPKKEALQLSNDLLRFLDERMKSQPPFPIPHPGMTAEDFAKQQSVSESLYIQWMNETASEERSRFALRTAQVMQDMQDEKIDTGLVASQCQFYNGNTFSIQECGTRIGVLAQKLSH